MNSEYEQLKIIGRLEPIDFPEWDIFDIDAKIDTGAYTSSLHCHHIEAFEREGKPYVKFNLLDPSHETYNDKLFKLPIHATKSIKSSNGSIEERYIIKTIIRIAGEELDIELSLADRSEMRYPVLIGRKLLSGHFLVDASKNNLSTND
ncbi:ATP-dependent zinc protease [Aliifodinibius sp. 1BSP15-2V2]|uniref:ATP-dependent zinc protease n=2 Tax=Fodinibius salsisoli TaxID=2820877 RepID=A0ABT3PJW1_9BACT|nr:ATP-dependent zinc protease [Fodinibius salsisoli]